jgi:hypothetical protein
MIGNHGFPSPQWKAESRYATFEHAAHFLTGLKIEPVTSVTRQPFLSLMGRELAENDSLRLRKFHFPWRYEIHIPSLTILSKKTL